MSGLRRSGRERIHDTCSVVRRAPRLLTDHMTELPPVRAPRIPVTGTFHGVDVTEDYRWLEDASSEETIAWTKAQQHRSRTYFGGIPWRDALRARVEQLMKSERTTYNRLLSGGSTFFALKVQTPRQQPFLVALTTLTTLRPSVSSWIRMSSTRRARPPSTSSFRPRTASRSRSRCRSMAPRTGRCTSTTWRAGRSSMSRSRM